jgi:hypothetical protein
MRVKALAIFQEVMTELFSVLDFVILLYLDAILILSDGSLDDHIYKARCFLGMVDYYSDLRRLCSHLLSPLSQMVSEKSKFIWVDQKAFEEIRAVISRGLLLSFPNLAK